MERWELTERTDSQAPRPCAAHYCQQSNKTSLRPKKPQESAQITLRHRKPCWSQPSRTRKRSRNPNLRYPRFELCTHHHLSSYLSIFRLRKLKYLTFWKMRTTMNTIGIARIVAPSSTRMTVRVRSVPQIQEKLSGNRASLTTT